MIMILFMLMPIIAVGVAGVHMMTSMEPMMSFDEIVEHLKEQGYEIY